MRKIGRNTKIIIAILSVLTAAVIVLGILNYGSIEQRRELNERGAFLLTSGDTAHNVTMDILLSIGSEAVSSGAGGQTRNFTGVPLAAIFDYFEVDCSNAGAVIFASLDGFTTAISIDEALDRANSFIVFEENGAPLGERENGGIGPYMVVMALDRFQNRWARYLVEVTLS